MTSGKRRNQERAYLIAKQVIPSGQSIEVCIIWGFLKG